MNLEYFYATVKPDIVCSICKDLLFNSMAECKSICAALGQEWSWTSWMFSITELVRRFGFTLFNKPRKQLTNPFSPLRNCREMEQLIIHSSPFNSWHCSFDRIHCLCTDPGGSFCTVPTETLLLNEFWPFKCHNCHSITFLSSPWCCLQQVILVPQP